MKRTHVFIDEESITTAGIKDIDIKMSEKISAIDIIVKGYNNGSVPTAHPAKMVTKIELIDGSDVLASVSGLEAQAARLTMDPMLPYPELDYVDNTYAIPTFRLMFGRKMWDKQLSLDPKKFTSLQLRITHNKALGGSVPDAGVMTVMAHVFTDEPIAPVGFLSLKQVRSYALASGADEDVQIPTKDILRRILIQSLYAGKQPQDQFANVKLSLDDDAKILLNRVRTYDLLKLLPHNPDIHEMVRVYDVDSETTVYVTPTYAVNMAGNGMNASEVTLFFDESYGGTVDMTAGAAGLVGILVHGKAPHGALNIPLGDQMEIDDWLDARHSEELQATITGGASVGGSSTCEVVAETLRRY
jgi:hypothetical protein